MTAMERLVLAPASVHPSIAKTIATNHRDIVEEVETAIFAHPVVVVGMKQNPVVRKARKALTAHGTTFHYLEYGSYASNWRRRNALKMWTGWPTFPMIFVKATLIGGFEDLQKLIASGEFDKLQQK
jgi:monothiol glutaredoxin